MFSFQYVIGCQLWLNFIFIFERYSSLTSLGTIPHFRDCYLHEMLHSLCFSNRRVLYVNFSSFFKFFAAFWDRFMSRASGWRFLRKGLPFLAVGGSTLLLAYKIQQIKFDFAPSASALANAEEVVSCFTIS